MMRKRYRIEVSTEMTKTVYYPAELKESALNVGRVAFGGYSTEARLQVHPQNKNVIVISEDLKNELYFPNFNVPLHIFVENEILHLGPLVGIFTSGFTSFPLKPIGDRSEFFSNLLSVQNSVGAIPFIFGEQHIDWNKGIIEGYFYQKNTWERHLIPFPNVVYDRLPNRKSENRKEQRHVKERMQQEYLIPWYNPGFFNKLDIYEKLYNDYHVYQYLPETIPFTSFYQVEAMLSQYGHVYVKPINGSLGLGIHQILFDKDSNFYYCRYHDDRGTKRLQKFPSLEKLINYVFHNKSLNKMLVQQGISLIRMDNHPVDFRIHTNKDEAGQWKVTAIAAKIAGSGSVTTHVKNGGVIKTLDEIFTDEELAHYTQQLNNAALSLSYALERQVDGIIGEIGFDLGIDKQGQIWLFEANSKPGRSIFSHPNLKEFDLLTRKLSLAFAVFLAEQAIHAPEGIFK